MNSLTQKPAAVVFDLGKVLVDFDYGISASRIAAEANLPSSAVQEIIQLSPLLVDYETGRITTEQFFDQARQQTGYAGSLEAFCEMFADIFTPIEHMVNAQAAVRSAGIPTFIFSNTNELAVRHIRDRFSFFNNFDGYVLSYESGSMKPDTKIYEDVERLTGHAGPELLYLDDRAENIETGRARGWQCVHHVAAEQSVAILSEARR